MLVQTKPERWQCLPTAVAIALDLPVTDLLAALGHDGGEIVAPQLAEPMCRRGFHIQEIIGVLLSRGFAMTPVELYPLLAFTPTGPMRTVFFPDGNWTRFVETIQTSRGILEGEGRRCGHAVAYDHGRICDPDGPLYDFTRIACEGRGFYPRCAWRIDPIPRNEEEQP